MRRFVATILVIAIAGGIANVAVCLACANWSRPRPFDPLLLAELRREFFLRDTSDQQHFVDMAYPGVGTQFMLIAIESPTVRRDAIIGPYPMIAMVRSGWPWMAMEGRLDVDASRAANPPPPRPFWAVVTSKPPITGYRIAMPVMIPLKPMWPGFAANTFFFAACLASILALRFGLRWLVRRLRSRCGWCGYPVGQSPFCTECGRKVRSCRPRPA